MAIVAEEYAFVIGVDTHARHPLVSAGHRRDWRGDQCLSPASAPATSSRLMILPSRAINGRESEQVSGVVDVLMDVGVAPNSDVAP